MVWNPLPEYLDEEGFPLRSLELTPVDIEDEYEPSSNWLRKIRYRIGEIVVAFNSLENRITENIIELYNDRMEDPDVWAFLEGVKFYKKTAILSQLYDNRLHVDRRKNPADLAEMTTRKKKLFAEVEEVRLRRNIYVHANWYGAISDRFVEQKVRKVPDSYFGLARIRVAFSVEDMDKDILKIMGLWNPLDYLHESIWTGEEYKEE